jgi:GTP cyclohydrolase IA
MSVNRDLAQRAVADLLRSLGHDPVQEPELEQTPTLVVEALERDWLCGYAVDISSLFAGASRNTLPNPAVVVVSRIALGSLCPHHLLPSEGTAAVAYLPGQTLLGLGVLARLVDAYARRLTLQEQIGQNVVSALMQFGGARGAYCRLDLRHACLRLRGPRQRDAVVTTTHASGEFETPEGQRRLAEALGGEPAQ